MNWKGYANPRTIRIPERVDRERERFADSNTHTLNDHHIYTNMFSSSMDRRQLGIFSRNMGKKTISTLCVPFPVEVLSWTPRMQFLVTIAAAAAVLATASLVSASGDDHDPARSGSKTHHTELLISGIWQTGDVYALSQRPSLPLGRHPRLFGTTLTLFTQRARMDGSSVCVHLL